jgi:hypothetical protein
VQFALWTVHHATLSCHPVLDPTHEQVGVAGVETWPFEQMIRVRLEDEIVGCPRQFNDREIRIARLLQGGIDGSDALLPRRVDVLASLDDKHGDVHLPPVLGSVVFRDVRKEGPEVGVLGSRSQQRCPRLAALLGCSPFGFQLLPARSGPGDGNRLLDERVGARSGVALHSTRPDLGAQAMDLALPHRDRSPGGADQERNVTRA